MASGRVNDTFYHHPSLYGDLTLLIAADVLGAFVVLANGFFSVVH